MNKHHATTGMQRRAYRRSLTLVMLTILLVGGALVSAHLGQFPLSISTVLRGFVAGFGLTEPPNQDNAMAALWAIRFPRIALGIVVGGSLAVAGALMQAMFSNPLAEPGIIGVSTGSAMGAALAIVFFPTILGGALVPIFAFIFGLIACLLVYLLAKNDGRAESLTLVLTGIAVTAVGSALTSIAIYIADTNARDHIIFWQMGSLAGANWQSVGLVTLVTVIGTAFSVVISKKLDILALGEREATHLGVNVDALRIVAILLTALLTASAVAFAGVIGFVGLIVPHVIRLLIGPVNRWLIPISFLGGAVLITYADLAARTLVPFSEMPIGIFTALVGGPTFFILLRRNLRRGRQGL